jgi:DNA-directed RNA polymerase specialized sigma24 family protein
MFIEGERAVPNGLLSERAQELDSVVSRYLPMFYKRAFRLLGNMADAEDAVQDALFPRRSISASLEGKHNFQAG